MGLTFNESQQVHFDRSIRRGSCSTDTKEGSSWCSRDDLGRFSFSTYNSKSHPYIRERVGIVSAVAEELISFVSL